MLDLENIVQYKENNRIEAKKSLGGLPHSIWETYSAFANTMGGYILLGVVEKEDKSFETVDLPNPERLINEFLELLDDPKKVSANLLSKEDVFVEEINGNHIVVIAVPRADRSRRPVYIDGDPSNCYRRNGEGDYKCSNEMREAMIRDASLKSSDMQLLNKNDCTVFSKGSINTFRKQVNICHPDNSLTELNDEQFLEEIGAIDSDEDNEKHPTIAGLLMFGSSSDITEEFSSFSLEYREEDTEQIISGNKRCQNVTDFYFQVSRRLQETVEESVFQALCEALANSLVHADYYGKNGIVITKTKQAITITNPGSLRVSPVIARNGGTSDPRNLVILKMFNLIGVGRGDGSGIPKIFQSWKEQGWSEPVLTESFNPDTVRLTLPLTSARVKGKSAAIRISKQQMIIEYLTIHPEASIHELAKLLHTKPSQIKEVLNRMVKAEMIEEVEDTNNGSYRLRISHKSK